MKKSSYGFELVMTIVFLFVALVSIANGAALGLIFLIPAAISGLFAYNSWYNSTSHSKVGNSEKLSAEAAIIDIETEIVGLKGEHVFRTTVTFDDTFQYVSHKTNRQDKFMVYTIAITQEQKSEIIQEAYFAHFEALKKAGKVF